RVAHVLDAEIIRGANHMEPASRTGPVHYRTAAVGCISVFSRETGPDSAPAVLLLHGFPSSSRMFRNLIPGSRTPTTSSPRTTPRSATARRRTGSRAALPSTTCPAAPTARPAPEGAVASPLS